MKPDVHHSITHHPSAIQMHHVDSERQRSQSRASARNASHSTGIESSAPAEEHDPVARHNSQPTLTDVESQLTAGRAALPLNGVRLENDPYGLSLAYKTESDLANIKANTSRKRDAGATGHKGPKVRKRKIQRFYEDQNAAIERMLKPVEDHLADAKQEAGEEQLKLRIAVWGSFIANICLSILQLYGAISSGSLSLFTTAADSVFDPLSNLILIVSSRAVAHVDERRFPAGKARLETVGNITFSFIMVSVSLIIIAFSCQELSQAGEGKAFHLPAVLAVAVAFATKFCLFLYCWSLKNKYSQVRILWQDHRNDLFVNSFGILTSVGGSKLMWWLDPAGAIILSVVISAIWLRTAFAEFLLLVGVSADTEMQQLITYVCLTHSDSVLGIDTVRVYHSGPRLIAEVDIVMDPEETMREAHDVAEELQFKLEGLPDVERAYVHIDYETTHKPERALKKDL
ncbi:cation efflux family-domain-containing protein [Emericellopsis atlantica]|uniref:Cation efflux family-domain-containing protein n=1 Tax=Emericellopsis atlantica TaxID=2614577 RepID=A0A9P7ZEC9_9HYPO|nr:cation efflux family-domain-containing protein [Emericellopsis atlantica]KAG9250391.1 cation efflux family-domain-containing protein [Emericellopsis atlantica]